MMSDHHPQPLYQQVVDFLMHEAALLDDGRFQEWFDLLTEDIVYQIPVRTTRDREAGRGFSQQAWHMNETWGTLKTRVARLATSYAWAEDPPTRTRHFITNIRIRPGDAEDEVRVTSNVLLLRHQGDVPSAQFLSGERHDVLRRKNGRWRLARRLVLLDQTTLGTHNLAIFI